MQVRALENEPGVEWTDAGHEAVHQLRAAAYLNLSLCFLKTQQWTHASNTATRAMQGDKEPPDPKHDVLSAEKVQQGEGIFDDKLRPTEEDLKAKPMPSEPKK